MGVWRPIVALAQIAASGARVAVPSAEQAIEQLAAAGRRKLDVLWINEKAI